MAREVNSKSAREGKSPIKAKREGLMPLQELDPNICDLKRRKGKKDHTQTTDGKKQMDGKVAMAVEQHCRTQ